MGLSRPTPPHGRAPRPLPRALLKLPPNLFYSDLAERLSRACDLNHPTTHLAAVLEAYRKQSAQKG